MLKKLKAILFGVALTSSTAVVTDAAELRSLEKMNATLIEQNTIERNNSHKRLQALTINKNEKIIGAIKKWNKTLDEIHKIAPKSKEVLEIHDILINMNNNLVENCREVLETQKKMMRLVEEMGDSQGIVELANSYIDMLVMVNNRLDSFAKSLITACEGAENLTREDPKLLKIYQSLVDIKRKAEECKKEAI